MKLLTNSIREKPLRNGRVRAELADQGLAEPDFIPVVKLFTPDTVGAWPVMREWFGSAGIAPGKNNDLPRKHHRKT